MVLVDPGDGLEISGPAGASSLAVLGLERPSVLSESGSGVAAGGAGALLFMVRHPAASSAHDHRLGHAGDFDDRAAGGDAVLSGGRRSAANAQLGQYHL